MNIPLKMNKDFEKEFTKISGEYGEDFELLNGFHESQMNFSDFIDGFVDKNVADVTIDSNANASNKDIRSLISEKGKSIDKIIAFNKIFYEHKKKYGLKTAREWLETEYNGGFYLHDAPSATYMPYCYAYDLSRLATEGLFFLKNYNAKAPNHLTTFIDDVVEYISYMSNRSSGAVGIPNLLIWTYYFWKKDCKTGYYIKDEDYYLKQCFQKIIYRLNQPFMRIDQTAFVNVSIFDRNYLESLFGGVTYPDGTFVIDNIDELIEHQKIFMEVVSDIRKENMFTFPVLTYSLLFKDGKFVDEDFARWCSDHNTTWNDSNFFESDNVGVLSNCCRLLSDTTKLDAFINSIGGTALSIGSVKVNTINLMRIALETNCDEKKYLALLKKRTTLCCKTLDVVRHIIQRNIEKGLLPNYQDGAMEMSKQYCTVGILGLYEVIEAFGYIETDEFGYKKYTDKGIEFASKIFETINDIKDNFTNDYSFNVESVPAERAAIILCQKDNLLYDKNDKFIYSNQWIPLSEKCTIQEKIRLSSILDRKCSGGSIAHINIENNFPNKESAWKMLNYIAKNGVMYFAFNSKINECKNHHGFVGTKICPECGEPVYDTYQRIVGYLVPTRSYSKDRFKEFNSRKWYEYSEMMRDL
jgi:Oxygen-sensitive ribonucleoside-triphosphate reductase